MANAMLYVLLIVAGIFLAMVWGKVFAKKGGWRTFVLIAGIVVGLYAVVGLLGSWQVVDLTKVGADKLFLATTGAGAGNQLVMNQTNNPTVPIVTNSNNFVIGTLKAKAKEKYSGSYSNIGTGTQFLKIYDASTNPSSPTASPIDTINISSGSGSTTQKLLQTNIPYRVVFDGAGVWYDKDLGIITFDSSRYNAQTSELLFDLGEIAKIGTIDDMITEVEGTDGAVNGATNSSDTSNELIGTASDTLTYDESAGDGQFYIKPTLSFSGAFTEVKQPVLCFQRDTTNAPEGNEISSITAQLLSGSDFQIPAELVSYWSNEECVLLSQSATGGQASQIKMTFTIDEANSDANDDWYLYLDDLGKIRGKDSIVSNAGATPDSIKFDVQA